MRSDVQKLQAAVAAIKAMQAAAKKTGEDLAKEREKREKGQKG